VGIKFITTWIVTRLEKKSRLFEKDFSIFSSFPFGFYFHVKKRKTERKTGLFPVSD
jgi:hypothetical protein